MDVKNVLVDIFIMKQQKNALNKMMKKKFNVMTLSVKVVFLRKKELANIVKKDNIKKKVNV